MIDGGPLVPGMRLIGPLVYNGVLYEPRDRAERYKSAPSEVGSTSFHFFARSTGLLCSSWVAETILRTDGKCPGSI